METSGLRPEPPFIVESTNCRKVTDHSRPISLLMPYSKAGPMAARPFDVMASFKDTWRKFSGNKLIELGLGGRSRLLLLCGCCRVAEAEEKV